jgi:uncharacterized protein
MAQTKLETAGRKKILVANAFDAWVADTGGPFNLLSEDATWTIAGRSLVAKTYPDRDSFIREVIRPFNARMRERLIPTVKEITAEGDRVVVRFDAAAIAHDGQPYTNSYAWFLTVRNDRIVDAIAFFDSIAFDDLWNRVAPLNSSAALQGTTTSL